jgi:hypothetical protein
MRDAGGGSASTPRQRGKLSDVVKASGATVDQAAGVCP